MQFKERPEDFRVEELMELEQHRKGAFAYFLLTKRDWSTFEALGEISGRLRIKPTALGYAGLKDKKAITVQHISAPVSLAKKLMRLQIEGITLEPLGYGDERITLGMLKGNRFMIVVRDVDEKRDLHIGKVRNLFDTQRFGKKTVAVGRALVQHNFQLACRLLKLNVREGDYVGALRRMDRRLLRFAQSSYQSWMWNSVAEKIDDAEKIPLLGYLTEFSDKRVERLYRELMKEEKITLRSFLLPSFPELSSEGSERELFFEARDFSYQWEKDELHGGKWKCVLTFFLSKGCYATLVVKGAFPGVKDRSI